MTAYGEDIGYIPGLDDVDCPVFYVGTTDGDIGVCSSLDESIHEIFSHWAKHPQLSSYIGDYYKLEYVGRKRPGDDYIILVDMGDPFVQGRIAVQ